ncbi:MAG: P22 phage major capsid protein family protein [Phycisphaerales bacterium JB052]
MAIITNTEAADIIPTFWLNEVIQRLNANMVVSALVRRDFSAETASKGDTVNIMKRGAVTVRDKAQGTPITSDAPENDKIPVVLDKHKYISWAIEDNTSSKALDEGLNYLEDAVPALAEQIEKDVLDMYANIAMQHGTAGQALGIDDILEVRKMLNEKRCPQTGRIFVVSTKDEIELLKLDQFIASNVRGAEGATALREASLGRIHGFDFYMSQLTPVVAGTPDTTHNLAFHPRALCLTSRAIAQPPQGAGVISQVIVDPMTGMAFRYTQGYSIKDQATIHTVDVLYGVAAIESDTLAVDVIS